jgi:hypothetical protein
MIYKLNTGCFDYAQGLCSIPDQEGQQQQQPDNNRWLGNSAKKIFVHLCFTCTNFSLITCHLSYLPSILFSIHQFLLLAHFKKLATLILFQVTLALAHH